MRCLRQRQFRRLGADEEGSTALEFGFVVVPLVLLLIGVMELSMIFFADTVLEAGLREAARFGITGRDLVDDNGQPIGREDAIVRIVNEHGYGRVVIDRSHITSEVYKDFANIGQHEPIAGDDGQIGVYEPGIDAGYTDVNCNGQWDADISKDGAGGGNDVVIYTVSYEYETMTAFFKPFIGKDGKVLLDAKVAVRNEPFGATSLCDNNLK